MEDKCSTYTATNFSYYLSTLLQSPELAFEMLYNEFASKLMSQMDKVKAVSQADSYLDSLSNSGRMLSCGFRNKFICVGQMVASRTVHTKLLWHSHSFTTRSVLPTLHKKRSVHFRLPLTHIHIFII